MINAIIIEDVPATRATIKSILSKEFNQIRVIGEAGTVDEGYSIIKNLQPDLVFMDIQLEVGTSFDILTQLKAEDALDFGIVFFTAYRTYENATKAIKYSALDFITKPIDTHKLQLAVKRAEERLNQVDYKQQVDLLLETLANNNNKSQRIAIHLVRGIIEFVDVNRIMYLKADGSMTKVFLENGQQLHAAKNLGHYGNLLKRDYDFYSISNSVIVNLAYVKRYTHRELTVELQNGVTILASRRGGQEFKNIIK